MAAIRMRYVRRRKGSYYFQPTPAMVAAGFRAEALGKEPGKAAARAAELLGEWDALRTGQEANPEPKGSIAWLVREFEGSDWYLSLKPGSKANADVSLRRIVAALGRHPAAAVERRHCRKLHDKLAASKSRTAANDGIKYLRRLFAYAIEAGVRHDNPAARMGLRQHAPRRERWEPHEIRAFRAKAAEMGFRPWALAVQLAYDTTQRRGDILAAAWTNFDGEGLTFRQAKTGADVWTPLSAETLAMLAETPRESVFIVCLPGGRPIGPQHFERVFRQIRAATEMRPTLWLKDLRRTGISEIYAAGGHIEPISGHRPGSPVRKHYAVPDKAAARAAQGTRRGRKLEPGG